MSHIPVLLNEVLEYLQPKPGDNFIDCTVGEGGHAIAILKMIAPNGKVLGIDRDADTAERLRQKAKELGVDERFIVHHGNFADIENIAKEHDFGPVSGIVFDFGLSSWQLDESGAGFSFQNIEPLDMRFDRTSESVTAADIINSWPEEAIARIIYEFGEDRLSRRIAKAIVIARKKERIATTDRLAEIISGAVRGRQKIHPATRTFQALRIAVNDELENVKAGVTSAINILEPEGRIGAISFHSLEDRIIKNIFRDFKKAEGGIVQIITKKPLRPSREEILENPRARSAKFRVAEKNPSAIQG